MTRKEQLQSLWDALHGGGFVRTKKEMAERLGMTYHSLSAAFSQGEPYVNDKLLGRIRTTFAAELEEVRQREMAAAAGASITIPVATFASMQETIASQQRTIERLVSGPLVGERVSPKKIDGDRDND